ncbi:penicillin-binding transpeptidase domain-containing protein [Paenarthrobacter sp. Z7-10]|uniref:penicillin-binding transpeptidase domain-containing protein n=1 Tax=Paenarthrobacter sp. Z7-10 TaxID=2787635 RepID=UPI002E75BCA2|nr:penicillin-binding transpeptidase domain-containing protein [Paenarthrobacter sp. Z7-10]
MINFSVDQVNGGGTGFQPGSTVKTVTFAEWLNEGHSMNETVDASQRIYPADFPWKASCKPDQHFFGAYDNTGTDGPPLPNDESGWYRKMTVREGIVHSINTATFASAAELDLCGINAMGKAMGLHSATDGSALDWTVPGISSLIGGGKNVAPLTMANAFATFASGGIHCNPTAITAVTDSQGKKYPVPGPDCKQAINPDVAKGVNYALQQVITKGSAYGLDIGTPAGAKTGTTDASKQTWMIGYTPKLATASWWGWWKDGARQDALDYTYKGKTYDQVDGAYIAGPQWQNYMKQAITFYPSGDFPAPPESTIAYPSSHQDDAPKPPDNGAPVSSPPADTTPSNAPPSDAQPSKAPPSSPPASAPPADKGKGNDAKPSKP